MLSSNIILDPGRLAREVEFLGNEGTFFYDIETLPSGRFGNDDRGVPSHNRLAWIGFSAKGRAIQVPMGHPIGSKVIGETKEPRTDKNGKVRLFRMPVYDKPPEQMSVSDVMPVITPLFTDPGIVKAAHGATFDNASMAKYLPGHQIPAGKLPCTIVMNWLTNENRKRYGLKYVTKDLYKFEYDDEEVGRKVEAHPFDKVAHYLYCDVKFGWLEYQRCLPIIRAEGLDDLYDLETDLVSVLSYMRTTGVPVDVPALEKLKVELAERVEGIERDVWAAAGHKFNLNAAVQKQAVFFKPKSEGGQGLKPWKLTDGGKKKKDSGLKPDHTFYSTDDESLDGFRDNPVVGKFLEYQESSKVLGTYVMGYLGDPEAKDKPTRIFDGKIYPDFVQYGAATGRFCFTGDTLVETPRDMSLCPGGIPITEIKEGDWVYSFDEYNDLCLKKVLWAGSTGVKKVIEVTLENSDGHQISFTCTPDHLIKLYNGDWRMAQRLNLTAAGRRPTPEFNGSQPVRVLTMVRRNIDEGYAKFFPHAHRLDRAGDRSVFGRSTPQGNGSTGGGKSREHRWIMSQVLGKRLSNKYDVDHIDGNKLNNHPDNLRYVPTSVHRGNRTDFAWGTAQPETPDIYSGITDYRCVSIEDAGTQEVYDLEVEDTHTFIANGVAVHNSSRTPNLQNVPRPGSELGDMVRGLFIAEPGRKLIVADYDQIELVFLAHFIGHGALFDGFKNGIDPHKMTAAMALGKKPEDITKDERQRYGKSINFAVVYGAGITKLASMMKVSTADAKKFKAMYDKNAPEVDRYRKHVIAEARRQKPPHVTTLMGRKRRLASVNSLEEGLRMSSERQLFNAKIQGSSADLTKMAMVRFYKAKDPGWNILLSVHDELVIDAPENEVQDAQKVLAEAMCGPDLQQMISVPLKAESVIVDSWDRAK